MQPPVTHKSRTAHVTVHGMWKPRRKNWLWLMHKMDSRGTPCSRDPTSGKCGWTPVRSAPRSGAAARLHAPASGSPLCVVAWSGLASDRLVSVLSVARAH